MFKIDKVEVESKGMARDQSQKPVNAFNAPQEVSKLPDSIPSGHIDATSFSASKQPQPEIEIVAASLPDTHDLPQLPKIAPSCSKILKYKQQKYEQ